MNVLRAIVVVGSVMCLLSFSARDLFSVTLKDAKNQSFSFSQLRSNKASVLVFLSPECPLCQSYSLTLNQLEKDFQDRGVRFYGIVPDASFSNAVVNSYAEQYQMRMPMLRDNQREVTGLLAAKVTPEVVVVNSQGTVVYQGRIDNWAYELGKKRRVITEHNLKDALTAIVSNKSIAVKKTKAIGCFIE